MDFFFLLLLMLLLKVTKVITGDQKMPKMGQNSIISSFFARRAKKASAEGRSSPQELEVSPRSGLYLLVKLHKEVDHKNVTSFFNRLNQLIGEKMFPILRSTSIRQFLHPSRISGRPSIYFLLSTFLLVHHTWSRFVSRQHNTKLHASMP